MCLCCFNKQSMKARRKRGKLIFIQVLFIKMLNQKKNWWPVAESKQTYTQTNDTETIAQIYT